MSRDTKPPEDRHPPRTDSDNSEGLYEKIKRDGKKVAHYVKLFLFYILIPLLFALSSIPGLIHAVGLTPDMPANLDTILDYSVYWSYVVLGTSIPSIFLYDWIQEKSKIQLVVYNARSKSLEVWEFASDLWDKVQAETEDGDDLPVDDLDNVHTKEGAGYAAKECDSDEKKIVGTHLAGANQLDLTFHKSAVEEINTNTYKIANAAIDVLARREGVAREAAMKEILKKLNRSEDVNLDSSPEITALEELLVADDIDTDELVPEYKKRKAERQGDEE